MAFSLSQYIANRFLQPAIDAHVEKALGDKQPYAFGVGMAKEASLKDAIGQPHDAPYDLLYSVYRLNVDVSFGVRTLKGSTTSRGWHLDLADEKAQLTASQEADMAEISAWLRHPNPHKGIHLLLEELFMHLAITGDAFWFVSKDAHGKPLEIWSMHPALTRIVATKQGEILGYIMRVPGEETVTFEADEVLHFTTANPTSDIYGEGSVELVLEEAGIDLQALRSNKAIFTNGMNPSAVVMMDDTAKPGEAQEVTDRLRQSHTGSANQHKVVALNKVKDFKPWTMTNRDLEYLGLRNLSTTKVARGFQLPVFLFGEHNAGDFATAKFLIRETHQNVYIPMQNGVAEVITNGLIALFDPTYCFKLRAPDSSNPDELRRDYMQAKREGIVEVDEAREHGFGLNPLQENATTPSGEDEDKSSEGEEQTGKAIAKALTDEDATTLADSRAQDMEDLAQAIEPSLVQFFTAQEARFQSALTEDVLKSTVSKDVDGYLEPMEESEDVLLHALLFGLLVASLDSGLQAAQLQIGITLSLEQTNPIVQNYLQTNVAEHVKGINQTTRDRIRTALQAGIDAGEGIPELKNRVAAVFNDAKGYRASVIARTETAQAYNHANAQALEATGVVREFRWIVTSDERLCPTCSEMSGRRRLPGDTYENGAMPGFIHVQCRCDEVGVVDEEAA